MLAKLIHYFHSSNVSVSVTLVLDIKYNSYTSIKVVDYVTSFQWTASPTKEDCHWQAGGWPIQPDILNPPFCDVYKDSPTTHFTYLLCCHVFCSVLLLGSFRRCSVVVVLISAWYFFSSVLQGHVACMSDICVWGVSEESKWNLREVFVTIIIVVDHAVDHSLC